MPAKNTGNSYMDRCVILILALAVTIPVFLKSLSGEHHATGEAFSVPTPCQLISVSGDVRHPGIYLFSANSMADSVIKMAEPLIVQTVYFYQGVKRLPIKNGSDIHVAQNRDGAAFITIGVIPAAQRILLGIPLDMNVMTKADFERVPGIGPVLAQRIVECRQFNGGTLRPEDLLSVKGIGKVTYYKLKKYF